MWWYDRQGCIQSQGINFVEDPSSFFVLLFAFQRFTLADWGFDTRLDTRPLHLHTHVDDGNIPPCHITIGTQLLTLEDSGSAPEFSGVSLHGRGTTMLLAKNEKGDDVALKVFWPERVRLSEGDIIQTARDRAGGNHHILDHLPLVHCSDDFGHDTDDVRRSMGISTAASPSGHSRHSRYLYLIGFDWLLKLTLASGNTFVRAWLDAVRCKSISMYVTPSHSY